MDAQTAHLVEKGDRVHVRQECAGHSDAEQEICAARERCCDIGRNGSCYVRRLIRRQTLTVYDRLHDPAHGDVGKAVLHADDERHEENQKPGLFRALHLAVRPFLKGFEAAAETHEPQHNAQRDKEYQNKAVPLDPLQNVVRHGDQEVYAVNENRRIKYTDEKRDNNIFGQQSHSNCQNGC